MRPEGNLAGPAFGVRFPSPLGDGWVLARRLPPLDEGQRATCTQRASSTASDAGAPEARTIRHGATAPIQGPTGLALAKRWL